MNVNKKCKANRCVMFTLFVIDGLQTCKKHAPKGKL